MISISNEQLKEIKLQSKEWPSWTLTERQICDLELILNGGFAPLASFLGQNDYERVCEGMSLQNGTLWPIPVVLDVSAEFAKKLVLSKPIALRNPEGVLLANLWVEEIWEPNRQDEAKNVYQTTNPEHPGVFYLFHKTNSFYISGTLQGVELPHHYDFRELRLTPQELKDFFVKEGWSKIVAFQTRNPMHRAHVEMTLRALRQEEQTKLLIHPVVGLTKPGDVDHFTRVRCYRALLPYYPPNTAKLSLLPLAMRMAGPREAVLHAIIRKNYGCTHFIIGRDHAGPGKDSQGKSFYEPYAAQELLKASEKEIPIKVIAFNAMVYLKELDQYVPEEECPSELKPLTISGTELRKRLSLGQEIPQWFTYPEVAQELALTYPERHRQGFTVFFTGLPSSGKSTLANILIHRLLEQEKRPITLLDGDLVRKMLSSELTFSKEHRDLNIRRIGYVASEVTKSRGIAICAPIAPYQQVRQEVREMVQAVGGFILVYVSTPLAICEERDRKGLYLKAKEGLIQNFTGVSDPYESPEDAEIVLDTKFLTPTESVEQILSYLKKEMYIE